MSNSNDVYLRSTGFDIFFIGFIPLIAISAACFVCLKPEYFGFILLLDLLLLGYHHVISTYTRLAFDKKSLIENRILIFYLPPIVLLSVFALAVTGKDWLIATVYLHWQWYHYSRQSEGISKSIRFKSNSQVVGSELFNRFVFYLVPTACFMAMSSRQPETFLFMDIYTVPVPPQFANILLAFSFIILSIWLAMQLSGLKSGLVKKGHLAYLLSHHLIYIVAYISIENISTGWLAINIWHNFQYISFVWHFNRNKYKAGVTKSQPIISWLSQPRRVFFYVSSCLAITYIFYSLVFFSVTIMQPYTALPLMIIAYQSINFHHYIVDSVIWKLRKPDVRQNLDLQL